MKKILIAVDIQNDFVTGALGSGRAVAAAENAKTKIESYVKKGYTVIFTRDTHADDYLDSSEGKLLPVKHCVTGTEGREIYGGLDKNVNNKIIVDKPNFGWRGWESTLNGLAEKDTELEIIGLCTDVCVVSNALILKCLFPDNKITVDGSCCAGVTEAGHEAALLTMRMCQINII